MDFKTATDTLTASVTHGDIADAMKVSVQSIRQARLDDTNANFRTPPSGWRQVMARLARQRSQELLALAAELERDRER